MSSLSLPLRLGLVVAVLTLATLGVENVARADVGGTSHGLSIDWGKLADALAAWRAPEFVAENPSLRVRPKSALNDRPDRFVGVSPHVSLIARDWGQSHHLAGASLALTDEVRLNRSSRMVYTRVRYSDGAFSPFSHVGIGQWRADADMVMVWRRDTELAAQVGGGFDLAVQRRFGVAVEVDCTFLYREQKQLGQLPDPLIWGAFVVSRLTF